MNPESRMKLIRSLEEIKLFEQNNYASTAKTVYKWGMIIIYCVIAIFAFGSEFKRNILLFVFMITPTVAYSIWLGFRNKLDERHKLLANAVLELGSIAQEVAVIETPKDKIGSRATNQKKKTTNHKKK